MSLLLLIIMAHTIPTLAGVVINSIKRLSRMFRQFQIDSKWFLLHPRAAFQSIWGPGLSFALAQVRQACIVKDKILRYTGSTES